jgi:hypothetical protein
LFERDELDAALDPDLESPEAVGQDQFRLCLCGCHGARERAVDRVERNPCDPLALVVHLERGGLDARVDQLVEHAHAREHLEAASVDDDCS